MRALPTTLPQPLPNAISKSLLIGTCILISSCTDTVYREVPQTVNPTATAQTQPIIYTTDANGQLVPVTTPANMTGDTSSATTTDGVLPVTSQMSTSGTTTGTTLPITNQTTAPPTTDAQPVLLADGTITTATSLLAPTEEGTVTGLPGEDINCNNTVPCRWLSADSQFALTVSNADNIASQDRLSVNFNVTTIHDTSISIGSFDDAVDSGSMRNKALDFTLNGSNSSAPVVITAGTKVLGTVNYTESASTSLLSNFSLTILDNGTVRKATFFNLPIGSITTDFADCNLALPCNWVSPDGEIAISLLSAGGYASNGRLTANFKVISTRDMDVAVDSGASAISSDGTRFTSRTHTLGSQNGFEQIIDESIANIGISGSVDFFRTDTIPVSLVSLSLVIYEDAPSPRWNPRFVSVPVQ